MTFNMLVNAKIWCSMCERYGYYDYQCRSKSHHVRNVPSDDVDDSKVVEDVHVPSKNVGIIENIAVGSDTPNIDEIHVF